MKSATVAVIFLFLLNGFASQSTEDGWELELIQIIFRNGHSSPGQTYPNDPNGPNIWEDGLDELTMIGKKQLYNMGKYLKKRYGDFLTDNPHEVIIQSTHQSKCMNSALCLLASLYVPTKSWMFKEGLNWQPIPVDYEAQHKDELLGHLRNCPSVRYELELTELTPSVKTVLDMFKPQLEFWTAKSGMEVKSFEQAASLYYILNTQRSSNLTIPQWAEQFWDDLEGLNELYYKMTFSNPNILRVVGGPLLYILAANAYGKINGLLNKTNLIIYSGKSEHVAGVLGALDLLAEEPPFSNTLILEMYKRNGTSEEVDYAFKMFELNASTPDARVGHPKLLVVPGCAELCPLDTFYDKIEKWRKISRWVNICQFKMV